MSTGVVPPPRQRALPAAHSPRQIGREGLLHRFIGVAVGVPLEIVVIGIYIWFIRRFTMTRQVKAKVTGGLFSKDRVVTYVTINAIDPSYNSDRKKMADEGVVSFITEDFKICALVVSTLALAAFSLAIIAGVIF